MPLFYGDKRQVAEVSTFISECVKRSSDTNTPLDLPALPVVLSAHDEICTLHQNAATDKKALAVLLDKAHEYMVSAACGFHALTGLKNETYMAKEISIELERFSRGGGAFSLAMLKIDDLETIQQNLDEGAVNEIFVYVSELIKQSLRTFDDAYLITDNSFVLNLKQSTIAGGLRALERVSDGIKAKQHNITLNGETQLVTVSCCVAEPVPDQDVEELVTRLRGDLEQSERDPGQVFSYKELSPLQRYARSKE